MSPAAPREACHSPRFRLTGQTARAEGFHEIADWFATLARAAKTDAGRFKKGLDKVAEVDREPDAG